MLKKLHCTLFLSLILNCFLYSQNLVYNGSFEQYDTCPSAGFQLNYANHWFSANWGGGGSSEYFNACDNPGPCGVPNNFLGGHQFANTGDGYIGTSFYENVSESREYVEGTLITPLRAGTSYCVLFYVSLSDYSVFGIDALGVYFTIDSLLSHSPFVYVVNPQISNGSHNIITDKENWIKISGSFIASGGEKFLTLGNFKPNNQTDTIRLLPQTDGVAYYLIDDVVVYECDAPVYAANCGPDLCINRGESVTLGSNELPEYKYYWFNTDSNLISTNGFLSMMPLQSDTFYLMVRDFKYDFSWDTVYITVSENCGSVTVYVPNIFSPNNDGINDILFARGENIKELTFRIYNRWGELVFESSDISQGWDGRYKGRECAEGVYFYVAEVSFIDGNSVVKKGSVSLVR
jgi:gliding motility-associated-like protein